MYRRFVLLIATAAFSAVAADVRIVEEIAAKVNGDIITRGELKESQKELQNELVSQGIKGPDLDSKLKQANADALRDKIDELLLVQASKNANPPINVDAQISKWIADWQVQARISDPDKFAEFVRQQYGVTLEDLKQRRKNEMLAQRVIGQEVGSRIAIPEGDMKKYYEEHKADFVRQEEVFLSQILISTDGKTPEQAAEAEKKAKDLVSRARQGEKFSDLASANSDDPETARNGGYLGTAYKRGDLRKEIADLVFAQKRGYVSDPIKIATPPGFLILKVEEKHEAGQATFEEVKDEIQQILAGPKMMPRVREFLTKLRQEAFLEIREGYLDSGAAPGKDTSWHDVAQIKPQTTTKEEVAAQRRKKFLGIIPHGRVGPAEPKGEPAAQPAPAAPPAPAAQPATNAQPPETPVKK
ncbi:MAG: peptidylprolyl isomerase [Acidobacteriia bacterium]|nr:peptidylprolyl isomerase [Terriglobia bacterium]